MDARRLRTLRCLNHRRRRGGGGRGSEDFGQQTTVMTEQLHNLSQNINLTLKEPWRLPLNELEQGERRIESAAVLFRQVAGFVVL